MLLPTVLLSATRPIGESSVEAFTLDQSGLSLRESKLDHLGEDISAGESVPAGLKPCRKLWERATTYAQ